MRESCEGDEPVRDDLQLGVLAGEGDERVRRNALTPPRPLPERSLAVHQFALLVPNASRRGPSNRGARFRRLLAGR